MEPSQDDRLLAAITDGELAHDLRQAICAIGYAYDAWRPDIKQDNNRATIKRAETLEALRNRVAFLGATATLEDLVEAVMPLLGQYMETGDLRASLEAARDVTMHRWPMIRRCREKVAEYDGVIPPRRAGYLSQLAEMLTTNSGRP